MAKGQKKQAQEKINEEQLKKLCALQCTSQEIASFFDVSVDTLNRFCKDMYDCSFAEYNKKNSDVGKVSLRRTQFKQAEKSTAMSIWLGKQYLGQSDHVNVNTNLVKDEKDPLSMAFDRFMNKQTESNDNAGTEEK